MSTVFYIAFSLVDVSAQQDLFSWKALDDAPLRLLAAEIANVGLASDVGDAQEEMWGIDICRGTATIGSGGSNPTGIKARSKDTTTIPTTNLRANDTTKVSAGTRVLLPATGFNTRVGWIYKPTPEEIITFDEGDGFGAIQLMTTPVDAIKMSGFVVLEQL